MAGGSGLRFICHNLRVVTPAHASSQRALEVTGGELSNSIVYSRLTYGPPLTKWRQAANRRGNDQPPNPPQAAVSRFVRFLLTATISHRAAVLVFDRSLALDYQYSYGGITATLDAPNARINADFTGQQPGGFPGFGSGGADGSRISQVADPTVPTQDQFTITGSIEGFGAASSNAIYQYGVEFQFQDFNNSLGVTGGNPQNAVIISSQVTFNGATSGPQTFTLNLNQSSTFTRGSLADVATLISNSELDGLAVNLNAGQGTDFYGPDNNAGFSLRNLQIRQEQVPEPSSALLLGITGLAALIRRRR